MANIRVYLFKRFLLIPVTLFAIMALNFFIIQFTPGGPVELMISKLKKGESNTMVDRVSGDSAGARQKESRRKNMEKGGGKSAYRGAQGLSPESLEKIKKMYGFDKPVIERFGILVKKYLRFDFGESYHENRSVISMIKERMPVSMSLGIWSTLIIYLISIPLGILKALRNGTHFDRWSSSVIVVTYAIPGFLFAILLMILFAGGTFLSWFPLRGLHSSNFDELSMMGKAIDYIWHLTLPTLAMVMGGFTALTMLTKNSFLDEIHKQYVVTARAKGVTENKILRKHVARNALLLVISGFPGTLVGMLFTGSVMIEVIFSLKGLGLMGFEAVSNRDYPVMFATTYLFSLLGLVLHLVSDFMYHLIDPRIDFEGNNG